MHGFWPAQMGQPLPFCILSETLASQMWSCSHLPSLQSHQTLRPELQVILFRSRASLREGCHCAASCGQPFVKLGRPAHHQVCPAYLGMPDHAGMWDRCLRCFDRLIWLAHSGQPVGAHRLVRCPTVALQVKDCSCWLQTHCTMLVDARVTASGLSPSLPAGSHCLAMSGRKAARELHAHGRLPAHTGQPVPL